MVSRRHHILQRSRDRNFLLRWVLIIGVAGIVLGFAASHLGPAKGKLVGDFDPTSVFEDDSLEKEEEEEDDTEEAEFIPSPSVEEVKSQEEVADLIRQHPQLKAALFGKLNSETRQIFNHYAIALSEEGEAYIAARDALGGIAKEQPPPRFANEFYGHLLMDEDELANAATCFRREVELYPRSDFSRRSEVACLLKLEDFSRLELRIDEPGYLDALDFEAYAKALIKTDRWWQLTRWAAGQRVKHWTLPWTLVTLFAGAVWFLIIGLLGGLETSLRSRLLLYGSGFALGVVSIFVHSPLNFFQSDVIGLRDNGEFINDAVFYISGVGLREESVKLLLFVPLLPVLLKRRSSMEALAAAACVGLGFAVVENLGYSRTGGEGVLIGRLVTANFLHLGLTGLAGLALFHLVRWPKTRWEEFLATFVGVVVAHGLYDLFLGGYWSVWGGGIPWVIIFSLIVHRYLNTSREIREGANPALSPLGVFVIGGTLVVAFSWVHACWHQPLAMVMLGVGASALSIGVLAFIFINSFRHD